MGGKVRYVLAALVTASAGILSLPAYAAAQLRPSELVGLWWAAGDGAEARTAVRFVDGEFDVLQPDGKCRSSGSWEATRSGLFAGHVWHGSGSSRCVFSGVPWLEGARAYRVQGPHRELLDEAGDVVATLSPTDHPAKGWDASAQGVAPELSGPERDELDAEPTRPAVFLPATPGQLVGRWLPVGVGPVDRTWLEIYADGRWLGLHQCSGLGGRWSSGPDGALVTTAGAENLPACWRIPVAHWMADAAWAGMAGPVLVLYDATGQVLGHLVPQERG